MPRSPRRLSPVFALLGSLVLAVSAVASADPSPADRSAADLLFQEGKKLAIEGRFVEACPRFAQSQKLDPGVGTLLYLGECYEKTARLASAWATFREAADLARASRQESREKLALDRATQLDGRLARLVIEVEPGTLTSDLVVQRDGVVVLHDLLGKALPLDAGVHSVAATAPGRASWTGRAELTDGATARILIPRLPPSDPVVAPSASVVAPPATTSAPLASASVAPPPPTTAPPPESGLGARRTGALVAGGVGLVSVGVGTYFGLRAFSLKDRSLDNCVGVRCGTAGYQNNQRAHNAATAANIFFLVGAAALGAGATLWFWPSPERSTALRAGPGSLSLEGTF